MNDIFWLTDGELGIHQAYVEENIKIIEDLYILKPITSRYGKEYYPDVLQKCSMIKLFEYLGEDDEYNPPKIIKEDINDWIKNEPSDNQLKQVRRFVELHNNNKESIIDIKKRVYLYGREDIVWFCNVCMDLGYKAVEKDQLKMAYMENKTIYYPTFNLKVGPEPYNQCPIPVPVPDKFSCLLDLHINFIM